MIYRLRLCRGQSFRFVSRKITTAYYWPTPYVDEDGEPYFLIECSEPIEIVPDDEEAA